MRVLISCRIEAFKIDLGKKSAFLGCQLAAADRNGADWPSRVTQPRLSAFFARYVA